MNRASKDNQGRSTKSRNTKGGVILLSCVLIFCLGLGTLLFPVVSQWINSHAMGRTIEDTGALDKEGPGQHTWNYDEDVFAVLHIPKLSLELPIYLGSGEENLSRGVGQIEGTSLPSGGKSTHTVLAGHSGWTTNIFFTNLHQLELGDTFLIENPDETLTYKVVSINIIDPKDASKLVIQRNRDLATLLTCINGAQDRLIVTGERVEE